MPRVIVLWLYPPVVSCRKQAPVKGHEPLLFSDFMPVDSGAALTAGTFRFR
jgi:hypothetical protein